MPEFKLEIPLDASKIEGITPDQEVKVLVRGTNISQSQTVKFDKKGLGLSTFAFADNPGPLTVLVGPGGAADDELTGMQTLQASVPSRLWGDKRLLRADALLIPPLYWHRWPAWCRTYVIRGQVVCPDGSPVPAARVCAYDVDWWFMWSNTELIGCDTTDINGAFEIRFRWCCGWWPWWWWKRRVWELNPWLQERVAEILRRFPDLHLGNILSHQPSLAPFGALLRAEGFPVSKRLGADHIELLEKSRDRLLAKLPRAPELEALHIWPWWPWWPWRRCAPDVIFKVTQDCFAPGTVIVNETVGDTRWNISNPLNNVTLTANQSACCLATCPNPPCEEGECIQASLVCGLPIDDIGGNTGAPAAPEGHYNPGAVAAGTADYNGDRPFAGVIPVSRTVMTILNVDYYEIEYLDGLNWVSLPPGAAVDFYRRWIHNVPGFPTGDVNFPFTFISGHNVVETKEHFEATGGLAGWGVNRFWLINDYLIAPIDTTKFTDGTYKFRVMGYRLVGGALVAANNGNPLPICGTRPPQDNYLWLAFDNRVYNPATHAASHNCGAGIHVCTQEPDTHISSVTINGQQVGACGTVNAAAGDLVVDFQVTDSSGYLGWYTLQANYGLNQVVNLLDRPGSVVTAGAGVQTGWDALVAHDMGYYGVALGQGAVAPNWSGGSFRLTVPAIQAFPEPCCYQLELWAYKRTIVGGGGPLVFSCDGVWGYRNVTQIAIGVGVCP